MSKIETLPSHSDTKLQELATDLDNFLGSQLEFETGVGKFEKQAKYILDDPADLFRKLSQLDGAEPVERVYQTDYYIIPQGIQPTFQSEYLRLREDNFQELQGINMPEDEMAVHLTYKAAEEMLSGDAGARTTKTIDLDFEQAYSVLAYLKERGLSYRKVKKERTIYRFRGMTISIDQDVRFSDESVSDESGESGLLGAGSFLEIMEEDPDSKSRIDELAQELGIQEPKIIEPYANVDFFLSYYRDRFSKTDNVAESKLEIPGVNEFDFVDYDPVNGTLTTQVDWGRVLKGINSGQANALSRDTESQAELQSTLKNKLGIFINKIKENPDKSLSAILKNDGQNGGQLSGSTPVLRGADGFSKYSRPKDILKEYVTFEIRGFTHSQIHGGGVRVMLTAGRTKSNIVVFFPHKIYMTKSDQDDRGKGQKSNSAAGWIERHHRRY